MDYNLKIFPLRKENEHSKNNMNKNLQGPSELSGGLNIDKCLGGN